MVPPSYDLKSRWVVKHKDSNCQWTLTPDLIRVCRSCANSGISIRGWVRAASISHFFLQTVWAQVWPGRSKLLETLTLFLIFYLETKVPIRLPVHRLVWAFVVRMYQRRISRDKVHTISKNSKLNVRLHSIYPRRFRLSVCPFVLSYVRNSVN